METLKATKREVLGKKVQAFRREGYLPAVLTEKGKPSVPILLNCMEFLDVYATVGGSALASLELGSDEFKVVIAEVDRDPLTEEPLHVSFHKVHMGEEVTATVPVRIEGESSVVKQGAGMLLVVLSELEIECLPGDLPAEIPVDISGLEDVGSMVLVKDLSLDFSKLKLLDRSLEDPVVKIEPAQMDELEEEVEEIPIEEIEITEEVAEEGEESEEKIEEDGSDVSDNH